MNKENNKSAAGLRRSAIAERIRLREEWSVLKGIESQQAAKNILTMKQLNVKSTMNTFKSTSLHGGCNKESTRNMHLASDALRGVVALVDVGSECRALPLRAALSALGASVLPTWSPLVTHLIWTQGGCRSTRARARALACRLVSPLWVEACASASKRLPEQAFPAATRVSDLPSPRTLQQLLKKAEQENLPIFQLLSDSNEDNQKQPRLRISSETELDTSTDQTNTTADTSADKANETSIDIGFRVNTAPRRALPKTLSVSPARPTKSRRKLFTQKEAELTADSETDEETTIPIRKQLTKSTKTIQPTSKQQTKRQNKQPKLTEKGRKELARAERMAKRILAGCTQATTQSTSQTFKSRIVLTGMSRNERRTVAEAIRALGGRVQSAPDRRTTHVLLGSCGSDADRTGMTGITALTTPPRVQKARTLNALVGAARGCRVLHAKWALDSLESKRWLHHSGYEVPHLRKISQKARIERTALGKQRSEYAYDVFNGMRVVITPTAEQRSAAIQLLTLCGAVVKNGGDRENGGQNQDGGGKENGGLNQDGGGTENGGLNQDGGRTENGRLNQDGGGNENGGFTQNTRRNQHGGLTQNGAKQFATSQRLLYGEFDIIIGSENGEISSKWVFDSVAASRMRTTRRYVINIVSNSDIVSQMENLCCDL